MIGENEFVELIGYSIAGKVKELRNLGIGGEAVVAIANERNLLSHIDRLNEAGLNIGTDGETRYTYRTEPVNEKASRLIIGRRI